MTKPLPHIEDDMALDAEADEGIYYVTPEEGRRIFDEAARRLMGMSGEEFIRRFEAGEYYGIADEPDYWHIGDLISMISLAR